MGLRTDMPATAALLVCVACSFHSSHTCSRPGNNPVNVKDGVVCTVRATVRSVHLAQRPTSTPRSLATSRWLHRETQRPTLLQSSCSSCGSLWHEDEQWRSHGRLLMLATRKSRAEAPARHGVNALHLAMQVTEVSLTHRSCYCSWHQLTGVVRHTDERASCSARVLKLGNVLG